MRLAGGVGEAWMWSVRVRVRVVDDGGSEVWKRAWEGFMRQETRWEVFAMSRSED